MAFDRWEAALGPAAGDPLRAGWSAETRGQASEDERLQHLEQRSSRSSWGSPSRPLAVAVRGRRRNMLRAA